MGMDVISQPGVKSEGWRAAGFAGTRSQLMPGKLAALTFIWELKKPLKEWAWAFSLLLPRKQCREVPGA